MALKGEHSPETMPFFFWEEGTLRLFIIWLTPGAGKINQILRCHWLPERDKMELSCPLGTTRRVAQEKFPGKPYNKSFIDQVCSVKMVGYWLHSFFACTWTSNPSRSINTQYTAIFNLVPRVFSLAWPRPQAREKNLGTRLGHLDQTSSVNNPYLPHFWWIITAQFQSFLKTVPRFLFPFSI